MATNLVSKRKGRMKTIALSISAALLAPSIAVSPSPALAAPDLGGLGHFDFPFNPADFAEFAASLVDDTVDITLTIDANGAATDCASAPPDRLAGVRLCDAARLGHLQVPRWYKPSMTGGHMTLHLDAVLHRAVPVRPIQFTTTPQGTSVRLAVTSGKCQVVDPMMDQSDQAAVCSAFDAAGRPGLKGEGNWLYTDTALLVDPARQDYDVKVEPVYPDRGQPVDFAQPAETAPRLTKADGRFHAEIPGDTYPTMVIEGTAEVLLGFDRTGAVQTCSPVKSTNSSFLAWWTCDKLVRHARFDFAASAPKYQGLRYFSAPVRWQFPND